MNLNDTCPVPVKEQLLHAFADATNWHDSHSMDADRFLDYVQKGGQPCDCEDDEDEAADPEHECGNLLDADECARQAQTLMGLAQAAATAALAAATMLANQA